jgi:hypothetical protein
VSSYRYLSPEWAQEGYRWLREELTPEKMMFLTSSMLTLYMDCPDGKDRALYYRFQDGMIDEV